MSAPTASVRQVMLERDDRHCVVGACARTIKAREMCSTHYHRWWRTGDADGVVERRAPRDCAVAGCDGRSKETNDLCPMHSTRVRRHGSPDAVLSPGLPLERNPRWTGEDASYGGLHQRLRRLRGRASESLCADCGHTAAHWSYNNSGVGERVAEEGRYSIDLDQYEPRCVPCHSAFDASARAD